jgi:hypothetical protein
MYELQLQYPVIYEGISLKSATLPYFCENFSQRLATNFLLKWENSTRQYKIPIIYLWEPNPEMGMGLKTSANALWNVFEDVLSKLSFRVSRSSKVSKIFSNFSNSFPPSYFSLQKITDIALSILSYKILRKVIVVNIIKQLQSVPQVVLLIADQLRRTSFSSKCFYERQLHF